MTDRQVLCLSDARPCRDPNFKVRFGTSLPVTVLADSRSPCSITSLVHTELATQFIRSMEFSFHANEPTPPPPSKNDRIDEALEKISETSGTLGNFLYDLFHYIPRGQHPRNSDKQKNVVSAFLGGRTKIKAEQIVGMMHDHPHSKPKKPRKKKDQDASVPVVEPTSKSWSLMEPSQFSSVEVSGLVAFELKSLSRNGKVRQGHSASIENLNQHLRW